MVSGANFLMVNKWIFKKWSYGNILKMKPSMQQRKMHASPGDSLSENIDLSPLFDYFVHGSIPLF